MPPNIDVADQECRDVKKVEKRWKLAKDSFSLNIQLPGGGSQVMIRNFQSSESSKMIWIKPP